jgi:uncharacterized protein (TIGR03086 family)
MITDKGAGRGKAVAGCVGRVVAVLQSGAGRCGLVSRVMTTTSELPLFPVPAPPVFSADPEQPLGLILPVLDLLADVVDAVGENDLARPTPCTAFDVAALRDHVVGWLQFFAAALADPDGRTSRLDPTTYRAVDDDRDLAEVVHGCGATIAAAVRGGVQGLDVAMSQSRMTGPSVLGMLLGEYLVHGWDLARALGCAWQPAEDAAQASVDFFAGMVAPEHRGGDGGFFAAEVPVPQDAPALDRLIGFAGRDLRWTPPTAG